jgi:hypothetical protein
MTERREMKTASILHKITVETNDVLSCVLKFVRKSYAFSYNALIIPKYLHLLASGITMSRNE